MVDALLSDRPDDRRALFEEAAGLGLYRDRKRSTERRLEETTADLAQLEQLVVEVESRVRSLSRQRRRSERHGELAARRYQLVAALARMDVAAVDAALATISGRRVALGTELPEARSRQVEREQERQAAVEARAGAEARRSEVERRVGEARLALSTLEGDLALAAERRANATARHERALAERTEAQASAVRVTRERDAASAERQAAERDRAGVQAELDARLAAEEATRARLAEQRTQLRGLEEGLQRQAEGIRRLDGERQALEREMGDLRPELSAAEARRAALTRDREVTATQTSAAETRHGQLAERLVSLGLEADRARHALAETREHEARLRAERRATEESLAQATARQGALEQLERDRVGLAPAAAALLGRVSASARPCSGRSPTSSGWDARTRPWPSTCWASGCTPWWYPISRPATRSMRGIAKPEPARCCSSPSRPARPARAGAATSRPGSRAAAPPPGGCAALLAGARPFAPAGDAIIRANGAVFLPGPSGAGGPLRRRAELEALGDDTSRLASALADQDRALAAAAGQLEQRQREAAEAEAAVELSRGEERHAAAEADDARRELTHVERDFTTERASVERLSDRLRAVQQRLVEVDAGLSNAELERVRLDGMLAAERARLTELENEHEAARERRVHWQVEDAQVGARLAAAVDREGRGASAAREFTDRGDALGRELASLETELATLEQQRAVWQEELVERRAALAELERASVSAADSLAVAERVLQEAEQRVTLARESVTTLGEESHRLELEGSELSGSRRVLDERLAAEWGKSLDQVLAEPAEVAGDADAIRAEAEEIRAQIEALGPVNPLAVEEHADEKRRLEHLVTQRDDILAGRNSLQQSVRELDVVARERFAGTFTAARANFQRVFETLFGGGSCDVFLVDETDPLESEIEIVAKPRGKRTERIHLLSQGERSLVALSLLFGIYLTKPSPFCLLDEVDAPLDDANIGRFTRLLEEFKDNTQFIVITHNPRTMAVADAVYGVTMQEPGVSSVVSVRLGGETQAA